MCRRGGNAPGMVLAGIAGKVALVTGAALNVSGGQTMV
jgi:hypothetical protein